MCRKARESKPVVSMFECTALLESVKGSANCGRLETTDIKQMRGVGPALRMFTAWLGGWGRLDLCGELRKSKHTALTFISTISQPVVSLCFISSVCRMRQWPFCWNAEMTFCCFPCLTRYSQQASSPGSLPPPDVSEFPEPFTIPASCDDLAPSQSCVLHIRNVDQPFLGCGHSFIPLL